MSATGGSIRESVVDRPSRSRAYWMTSVAWSSTCGGVVRPSAWASAPGPQGGTRLHPFWSARVSLC